MEALGTQQAHLKRRTSEEIDQESFPICMTNSVEYVTEVAEFRFAAFSSVQHRVLIEWEGGRTGTGTRNRNGNREGGRG